MGRSPALNTVLPEEGFYSSGLPALRDLPVRTFLPAGYEPNYPYPLVVLFHDRGGSDEEVLQLAPRISRRNHIVIALRGPQDLGTQADGLPGYSWGDSEESDTLVNEYLLRAVEMTRRTYHIHSERVFLAGVGEGAAVAYRLGLSMPDRIGGIIAINGAIPKADNSPLFRLPEVRSLRVLIGHGIHNETASIEGARRDFRLLYSAGVDVKMMSYPCGHQVHPAMLRDVNRWVIYRLNEEQSAHIDNDEERR